MLAIEFPSIQNLVEWPAYFGEGTFYEFNKVAMISVLAMLIPTLLFGLSRKQMIPAGTQNIAESVVEFVDNQIIGVTLGPSGRKYLPFLMTLFLFIFFGNLFEIIPTFQMPATARIANPMFAAGVVWVTYIVVGIKENGLRYFKASLFPSGVPWYMYSIVTPIEFISVFILRPFSLTVRLFANMLAGHILLVTFGVLCIALASAWVLPAILPFAMLVLLTGFEGMVAFLQAFIFTLLTAVYIDSSINVDH